MAAAAPPGLAAAGMLVDEESPAARLRRLEEELDEVDDPTSVEYLLKNAEVAKLRWIVARKAVLDAKAEQKEANEEGDGDEKAAAAEKVELAGAEAKLAGAEAKLAGAEAELAEAKADGKPTEALNNKVASFNDTVTVVKKLHAIRTAAAGIAGLSLEEKDAGWRKGPDGKLDQHPWTDHVDATVMAARLRDGDIMRPDASPGGVADEPAVHAVDLGRWPLLPINSPVLVTRRQTRDVYGFIWSECLQFIAGERPRSQFDSPRWAVVGNPGIGKSSGLTYMLRLALKHGLRVVFEARAVHQVFLFVPPEESDGPYRALSVAAEDFRPGSCPILEDKSGTMFIVDPSNLPMAHAHGAPHAVEALTVYAASPSKNNLKGLENLHELYMSCWEMDELIDAAKHISPSLTPREVEKRFRQLGGTLRYTLADDDDYSRYVKQQRTDADGLNEERVHMGLTDQRSVQRDADSPSFLFALCHDKPEAVVQDRFTTDNLRMGFLSEGALRYLFQKRRDVMLRVLQRYDAPEATAMGRAFEDIALQIVQRNKHHDGQPLEALSVVKTRLLSRRTSLAVFDTREPASVLYIGDVRGCVRDTATPAGTLVVPTSSRYPGVDAVAVRKSGVSVGLQVTIAEEHPLHSAECRALAEATRDAQHEHKLNEALARARRRIVAPRVSKPPLSLDVVFVVPWFRKDAYLKAEQKADPPDTSLEFVRQYVLVITKEMFFDELAHEAPWKTQEPAAAPHTGAKRRRV